MNQEIKMSVSSFIRKDGDKAVYVMFYDGEKNAEFVLPDCKLLKNNGFATEDIDQLLKYVDNERETIFNMAKNVNPIKGFMGN